MDTFGPVAYVLEHCRICFAVYFSSAHCSCCGNRNTPPGDYLNDWRITWDRQDPPKRVL